MTGSSSFFTTSSIVDWGTTADSLGRERVMGKGNGRVSACRNNDFCDTFRKQADPVMIEFFHIDSNDARDRDTRLSFFKEHIFHGNNVVKFFSVRKIKYNLKTTLSKPGEGLRCISQGYGEGKRVLLFLCAG